MNRFIYLDYQATTPVDDAVLAAMLPHFSEKFGNPASSHIRGVEAEHAVSKARRTIANGLQVSPSEVVFTSGASEANNLAIKGVARARGKGHIVSVSTEHKCVLGALSRLQQEGYAVTLLPVDTRGLLDPNQLEDAIRSDTILVSAMLGNNETGSLHSVESIARITRSKGIPFHCDATQAIGHLSIRPASIGIDLMTFSGHKIYGPKGIGVAYIAKHLTDDQGILPEIHGGGQERGLRGGTLNVPAIVGLQRAYELVLEDHSTEPLRAKALRNELFTEIRQHVECITNTPLDHSLPHCLNLSFPGVNGQSLIQALGTIALSSGSACNSGSQQPSHVLTAMNIPLSLIGSSVRLSIGRPTTRDDMLIAANRIVREVKVCRRPSSG
jgi:cysteine desulfurase